MDCIVGKHQHAYRKHHSTATCLMEINNKVCQELESKKQVMMYTIDLSAAFDMLRIDVFLERFDRKIPDYLLWSLGDFLTGRKFYVERDKVTSLERALELGCVQGSVLGPILFNMYLNDLPHIVNADLTVTYADDTYVILTGATWQECEQKLERTIANHLSYLKSRGMVCNVGKTEMMVFSGPHNFEVTLDGKNVKASETIKALGVTMDNKLKWNHHINKQTERLIKILNGVKIIRKKFEVDQMKKIITAQAFSILYYCDVVWLNPSTGHENYKKLNRIHYAALRLIVGDWKRQMHKSDLNKITKRLPPSTWSKYAACSFVIKMSRTRTPTTLWESMERNLYFNARHQNPKFRDYSVKKIGRKILQNWVGQCLNDISFKWYNVQNLSNDTIRLNLKKVFYSDLNA